MEDNNKTAQPTSQRESVKSYTVLYPQEYGITDDLKEAGFYGAKGGGVEFKGKKLPRDSYVIPASSAAYKGITSIQDEVLPERVAKHFASIMMETDKKEKAHRMEAYEADYLGMMGMLEDEGKYPATRENAERALWKMPLKGGPQNPSRKSMIMRKVRGN